jgi:hypothetical protein
MEGVLVRNVIIKIRQRLPRAPNGGLEAKCREVCGLEGEGERTMGRRRRRRRKRV